MAVDLNAMCGGFALIACGAANAEKINAARRAIAIAVRLRISSGLDLRRRRRLIAADRPAGSGLITMPAKIKISRRAAAASLLWSVSLIRGRLSIRRLRTALINGRLIG